MQGFVIFGLRIIDMSLFTMRLMIMARGYKLLSAVLGFVGSIVFVIAIRPVIQNISDWWNLIGYAAGFATGMLIGLILEERLAMGFAFIRIISASRGVEVAQKLRSAGFAVTEISAWGKQGNVALLHCLVRRKRVDELLEVVIGADDAAFISSEDVRAVKRGFWAG